MATTQKKEPTQAASTEDAAATLSIDPIARELLRIPIVGTAPLIVHAFSQKARQQMLDAQQGRKKPKEARDPNAEYEASMYQLKDGRYGFPSAGFKKATVAAARFYGKDVTMTSLYQSLFVKGEVGSDGLQLTPIDGEPRMREDVVRLSGGGSTDLRYRAEFSEWSATIDVVYVRSLLTANSVLSLVDAGGMGVGIGDWRPERKGDFGTYCIDPSREVDVVRLDTFTVE